MASTKPRALRAASYERWAQEYVRNLPLEHFMESIGQSTQRKITLESLDLLKTHRPDVQVFSELLVQYPRPRQRRPGQVVPDNMVVLSDEPVSADTSFNLPLEKAGPYWVLEYVSKNNRRKDYEDNFQKYERELRVPYYLIYYPEILDLTLYRHDGTKYVSVKPNKHERYPIPKLDLEVGLLDGWVRFWYKGELLPLPADLQRDLEQAKREAEEARRHAEKANREAEEAKGSAEKAKREADEARGHAEEANRRAQDLQRRLMEAEQELARLRGPTQKARPRRNGGTKPAK